GRFAPDRGADHRGPLGAPRHAERRGGAAHRHRVPAPRDPARAARTGPVARAAARERVGRPAGHPDPHGGHARPAASHQARGGRPPDRDGPRIRLPVLHGRNGIPHHVKLARRYALGTLVVLLIAIATLLWTAERALEAALTEDVAAHLEREAGLVSAALGDDPTAWQETVH